MEQTAVVVTGI